MIRGIIFDFDGTIVDSYGAITESLNHVRTAHKLPPIDPEKVKSMVGHGLEKLIGEAIGPERVSEGVKLFREQYAQVCEERTTVLPQVKETPIKCDRSCGPFRRVRKPRTSLGRSGPVRCGGTTHGRSAISAAPSRR